MKYKNKIIATILAIMRNPQITQRPGNRINPRRMSALKLATFFGGGLFGF